MDLKDIRGEIDAIDGEIMGLFNRRMDLAGEVARFKARHGLPVFDKARENEVIARVSAAAKPEFAEEAKVLAGTLMELSKRVQHRIIAEDQEGVWTE